MRALSANDVLQIWEWGQDKRPIDRALALLGRSDPDLLAEQLQGLSIGQRNNRLLALRAQTLGPILKGLAVCSQCGASLEFSLNTAGIDQPEPEAQSYSLQLGELALEFRPLNSLDLAALVGLQDIHVARSRLIERCLIRADEGGRPLTAVELPGTAPAALAEALVEVDPLAEMRFQLTCAACGYRWPALFDIVAFFWAELCARAEQLLVEVHTLARAYGWREADILALSEKRRHRYLELIG